VVADGSDEDRAQAQRLGRHRRVLGRQRGVDERDERALQVVRRGHLGALAGGEAARAAEVGDPDQEQRCLRDELLVRGQCGQAGLAFGVAYRDDAPGLEVRGGRRGLGGGDQCGEFGVGDVA
jgi:hypothetical protein